VDGGALLEKQQRFEEREGIFAAGDADGYTVAFANHAETADGFADFTQDGFFDVHCY
jgi:hypothetical protein